MTKPRKYRPGEPFADLGDLIAWLDAGGWCYWAGKPKHPLVIQNMALQVLRGAVRSDHLRRAEPNL